MADHELFATWFTYYWSYVTLRRNINMVGTTQCCITRSTGLSSISKNGSIYIHLHTCNTPQCGVNLSQGITSLYNKVNKNSVIFWWENAELSDLCMHIYVHIFTERSCSSDNWSTCNNCKPSYVNSGSDDYLWSYDV